MATDKEMHRVTESVYRRPISTIADAYDAILARYKKFNELKIPSSFDIKSDIPDGVNVILRLDNIARQKHQAEEQLTVMVNKKPGKGNAEESKGYCIASFSLTRDNLISLSLPEECLQIGGIPIREALGNSSTSYSGRLFMHESARIMTEWLFTLMANNTYCPPPTLSYPHPKNFPSARKGTN